MSRENPVQKLLWDFSLSVLRVTLPHEVVITVEPGRPHPALPLVSALNCVCCHLLRGAPGHNDEGAISGPWCPTVAAASTAIFLSSVQIRLQPGVSWEEPEMQRPPPGWGEASHLPRTPSILQFASCQHCSGWARVHPQRGPGCTGMTQSVSRASRAVPPVVRWQLLEPALGVIFTRCPQVQHLKNLGSFQSRTVCFDCRSRWLIEASPVVPSPICDLRQISAQDFQQ